MTLEVSHSPERTSESQGQRRLLVICEVRDGRAARPSLDLVSEARSMVDLFPGFNDVDAVVFEKMEDAGDTFGSCGAGTVYHFPTAPRFLDPYLAARALAPVIRELSPALILCAHTQWGSEIAPRLSVELDAPLISQCVGVTRVSDTGFSALQSIQNGHLHRQCSVDREGPIIISWDPDSLGRHEARESRSALVVKVTAATPSGSDSVRSMRIVEGDPHSMPLGEADRILAIGRGMDPADLPVLRELAGKIKASLGGTRPVIDAGSLSFERQIGQTGTTVAPSLLLAWGISGAHEFTVGIQDAETIICVNKDDQASMFLLSDLGLVGDGKTILRHVMEVLAGSDQDGSSEETP
jgi:electron transfer flavoprotein alpha subunit